MSVIIFAQDDSFFVRAVNAGGGAAEGERSGGPAGGFGPDRP